MSEYEYSVFDVDSYEPICDEDWAVEFTRRGVGLKIERPVAVLAKSWAMASAIAAIPTNLLGHLNEKEGIWDKVKQRTSSRQTIYHAQSGAFVLFFNAYETFMQESTLATLDLKVEASMKRFPNFPAAFAAAFGNELLAVCWHDPGVQFFMDVRNSFTNYGGSASPHYSETDHDIVVNNGFLKMRKNENDFLITHLHPIVVQFIDAVAGLNKD